MRNGNIASGLALAALGVFFIVEGQDLGLGRISDPGSGFMMFWVGWILMAFSVALIVTAWRDETRANDRSIWAGRRWHKAAYVVAVMALYAWAMPTIGFVAATILFLLVLFKTVEPQSWPVALIGSAGSTAVAWLLFVKALGTQLPAGVLGIG